MKSVADARERPRVQQLAIWLALTAIAVIVYSQLAVMRGADSNWDLQNYHIYNPFAVLEQRYAVDHNAAGIQSYINPTLDLLLTYPGFTLGNPLLATRIMGGLQGLNFVLILAIALSLGQSLATDDQRLRVALALGTALLGMSGALTLSELGTSFGDLTTGIAVLAGVLFALHAVGNGDGVHYWPLATAAGVAVGTAAGLKLTNGVYLVALGGTLILFSGPARLRMALAFAAGATLGLLATHGWWSWYLWQTTGNPVFPFFNRLFGSPFFPSETFFDNRFRPRDWIEALGYPFFFSWNGQTAELTFRDFRFPIAYVMVVSLALKLGWERRSASTAGTPLGRRRLLLLAAFLVLAYVVWQALFPIQRYAVAMELLLPVFILAALTVIFRRFGWVLFAFVTAFLAYTTSVPDWGHLRPHQSFEPIVPESVRAELAPWLEDTVVVLGQPPLAFVATAFPGANTTWIGALLSEPDKDNALRKVATRSRVLTLRRTNAKDEREVAGKLARLGLPQSEPSGSGCRSLPTVFGPLVLCEVAILHKGP